VLATALRKSKQCTECGLADFADNNVVGGADDRLAGINAQFLQDRHEDLPEALEDLAGCPDIRNAELVTAAVADMVESAIRCAGTGLLQPDLILMDLALPQLDGWARRSASKPTR
jgi:CheY-like chemotaxis protein